MFKATRFSQESACASGKTNRDTRAPRTLRSHGDAPVPFPVGAQACGSPPAGRVRQTHQPAKCSDPGGLARAGTAPATAQHCPGAQTGTRLRKTSPGRGWSLPNGRAAPARCPAGIPWVPLLTRRVCAWDRAASPGGEHVGGDAPPLRHLTSLCPGFSAVKWDRASPHGTWKLLRGHVQGIWEAPPTSARQRYGSSSLGLPSSRATLAAHVTEAPPVRKGRVGPVICPPRSCLCWPSCPCEQLAGLLLQDSFLFFFSLFAFQQKIVANLKVY